MTQEDKQLLLKDLCERLPYKVKAQYFDAEDERYEIATIEGIDLTDDPEILISQYGLKVDAIKPYLRPISSMTEEEQKEFVGFHCVNLCPIIIDEMLTLKDEIKMFDWLNKHHFDYRGLIGKGLALEAPEGMYETKTE